MWVCPVPAGACAGSVRQTAKGDGSTGARVHATAREALACERRFLLSRGYVRLGSRVFSPQDGGPVLVLCKNPGTRWLAGKGDGPSRSRKRGKVKGVRVW